MKAYLNEKGSRILDALQTVAGETGATPAEIAIAWLLNKPGVTAPIASATSLPQLESLRKAALLTLMGRPWRFSILPEPEAFRKCLRAQQPPASRPTRRSLRRRRPFRDRPSGTAGRRIHAEETGDKRRRHDQHGHDRHDVEMRLVSMEVSEFTSSCSRRARSCSASTSWPAASRRLVLRAETSAKPSGISSSISRCSVTHGGEKGAHVSCAGARSSGAAAAVPSGASAARDWNRRHPRSR